MLLILTDVERAEVNIITWFPAIDGGGNCMVGPLKRCSLKEFERTGFELVQKHFIEARKRRVDLKQITPLLPTDEWRRFQRRLTLQRVVRIEEVAPGTLVLIPVEFQKNSFNALVCLPEETMKYIALSCSRSEFFATFESVSKAFE